MPYSVNIGGATYSLNWLSPVAMPLFVGANAYEQLVDGKEWNPDVVIETLAQTLDPLSEMSFLSSLDDVLSSYDSGTQRFAAIGETMVQSYASQFVPTLSSQIAATMDDTKRSTKVSGNSGFKFGEETVRKLMYKIPGLRELLEPSTDIWGNEIKQSDNVMEAALAELPEQSAEVLRMRHYQGRSFADIGEIQGTTPERIRQIENKAIRQLRKPSVACHLRPFYDFDFYCGTGLGAFQHTGMSIQERYLVIEEEQRERAEQRRKEREEKQRKERFQSEYEEIMDRAMQEAQAKVARMTPEEKRALLEKYGYS